MKKTYIIISVLIVVTALSGLYWFGSQVTGLGDESQEINQSDAKYSCNGESYTREKFEAAISAKKSCKEAAELAQDSECRLGSTGDLYPDNIARDICNLEFERNNPTSELRNKLKKEYLSCDKIIDEPGTMYQSFQSYCYLSAIVKIVEESYKK